MIQKRVLVVLLLFTFLITLSPGIYSQDDDPVEKAYECLKNSLGDNCGDVKTTEQNAFNLLAMAYDSKVHKECKDSLSDKLNEVCWGDSKNTACNVKSTALSVLALNYVGDDVEVHIDWLKENTKIVTDLTWYLQIDADNETDCIVNGKKVTIMEDKKIKGSSPAGLTPAYNGYWFKINDVSRNYSISCDRDFITALVYQRPGSSTYHVSSDTHYASSDESTLEKVEAECFTRAGICDYESSLWATLVLALSGEKITKYIPYLLAMSEEPQNKKYLPAAFLYMLYGSSDEYYNSLVEQQKQNKYWDVSGSKFYDTSIALLALGDYSYDVVDNAKEYLLSVQGNDGCWGASTALILHAAWPRLPTGAQQGGGGDGPQTLYCDRFGYYCVSQGECAATKILDGYTCTSSVDVCCEDEPYQPTCSEKGGHVCKGDEECYGELYQASDSSRCCSISCSVPVDEPEENLCEDLGNVCKPSCDKGEIEYEIYSSDCDGLDICCKVEEKKKSNLWLIILLLVILIILVVLAIVYKDQLRVYLFKKKTDLKSDRHDMDGLRRPPTSPPPGFSHDSHRPRPQMSPGYPMRRPGPPMRGPVRRPQERGSNKDFDDTMRKLRDMSK